MVCAGDYILLMNSSGHACYLGGTPVQPGDFIMVELAVDWDPLDRPQRSARGPWGAQGWSMEQLQQVAREIRHRRSGRVLWRAAATASAWQPYATYAAGRPHTVVGDVRVLPALYSPQLQNQRDIVVYLPSSYGTSTARYPVVYMQDGQNLFDAHTSYVREWEVDETMEALGHQGLEAIVVGLPNMGVHRCNEYSPFEDRRHGGGCGAAYLSFLVDTVKREVDREFRTLPGREHTGIFGSSMGGLISLYGFFRHPETFGFVGAMSPSLWFAGRAFFNLLEYARRTPGALYVDVGTEEGPATLGDTRRLVEQLRRKGYAEPADLRYVEDYGAHHCEAAWSGRFAGALRFLLARQPAPVAADWSTLPAPQPVAALAGI